MQWQVDVFGFSQQQSIDTSLWHSLWPEILTALLNVMHTEITKDIMPNEDYEEPFKELLDMNPEADDFQNLISSSLSLDPSLVTLS